MPDATSNTAADPAQECLDFLARHRDIRFVDILLTDACGVQRGKRIPRAELERIWRNGRYMPGSIISLDITGADVEETGLVWEDGDADRTARPIPGTLVPVPWKAEPSAQVLLTLFELDGTPSAYDPRQVLSRVVSRLAADGLHPVVAVELEFYVFDASWRETGRPIPPQGASTGKQAYGMADLDELGDFLADLYACCEIQGLPADTAISEYAPGQVEINLKHRADALRAADDAILYKRLVRAVARRHGTEATFMAKPYAGETGSGTHLHISLADEDGGNRFAAEGGDDLLRHAIGGMGATIRDGMLVFAPNANSYRRFQTLSYAPLAPTWGINNRTVALRVPIGPPAAKHVEHRVAGADANPYLALAAALAGMHRGILDQRDPGPPVTGNGYGTPASDIPPNWLDSIRDFRASALMRDYLGDAFVDAFAKIKLAEYRRFHSQVPPLDFDWYVKVV
jgi:glutamine synthetase